MTLSMFGGGFDPLGMMNDPFFGFGDITSPFTFGTDRPRRRRRTGTVGTVGQADVDTDVGHWHFDYYLSEPVQLEMEEHQNKYLARLYHPGVNKNKIKLEIDNDTLIVSGEYEQEEAQSKQGEGVMEEKKAESQGAMETEETTRAGAGAGTTSAGKTGAGKTGAGKAGMATTEAGLAGTTGSMTRFAPRRQFKRFIRYMALPQDVDQQNIDARHEDEYLLVILNKIKGTTPRTQRIPIK